MILHDQNIQVSKETKRIYDKKYRANNKENIKKYREENRQKIATQAKRYREKNIETIKQKATLSSKKRYSRNKNKILLKTKECTLKRKYGISLDQYSGMCAAQNDLCAVCERPEATWINGKIKSLAVDHDHRTGKIRGLLCYSCNTTLGKVNEDVQILKNMINYLETNNA